MKDCGNCSLCCKLIEVPTLSPVGVWCPHCDPDREQGGCTIHNSRPSFCRNFHCFWRAESWPDEFRPDRCHVIFEALPGVFTVLVSVDPITPDAWREENIKKVISILCSKGRPVVLKTRFDSEMFIPIKWGREDVLKEIKQVIDWKRMRNGCTNIHN